MRDDFDQGVADQFKLLDQVSVPDTWAKVRLEVLDGLTVLDENPVEFNDLIDQDMTVAHLEAPSPTIEGRPRHRWMLTAAAALLFVILAVVLIERDSRQTAVVTTPTPSDTAAVESSFAVAVGSAGVLIEPSAEELATASDTSLYVTDSGSTQVSAAANFAALRTCPTPTVFEAGESPDQPCGRAWAYVTGSVDGGGVHRGVLGEADQPEVFVLDDRFFVAMETSPNAQRTPTAWLIDSVSGAHGELTWRDGPTTLNSPEQALVISDGLQSVARNDHGTMFDELFLPLVVDARDGTIRPLAVPDNASANLPVTQNGTGRIWIGTAPDGHELGVENEGAVQVAGFAYSDDGGATWSEVTIPAQLFASERLATKDPSGVSIAADGDHIAVTSAWSYNQDRYVYVSSDAGLSWSTVTVANPTTSNGAHLYVLADKRLLLVQSSDPFVTRLLASSGSDWTNLEDLQATQPVTSGNYASVNRDGIVFIYRPVAIGDAPPDRNPFSTDLKNWQTIPVDD